MVSLSPIAPQSTLFCLISTFDEIGGIQRFNQRVINALSDPACKSGRNFVLSLGDGGRRLLPGNIPFLGCAGAHWPYMREFVKSLMRLRPSVVLLGHTNLLPLAAVARLIVPRTKVALFIHGIDAWKIGNPWYRSFYQELLLKRFIDMTISVSAFTAELMRWEYHLQSMPFEILPNAVDIATDDLAAIDGRRDLRNASHSLRLLSVARLADTKKGIAETIRAVSLLRNAVPHIVYKVIGDGAMKATLMRLAKDLKVDDCVHFVGLVGEKELADAYDDADVFVLPSAKEGFGIVFLEAWKHGLPVVCGNTDAASEVVIDGQSGVVVDSSNVEQLAHALQKLINNPERRRRLARNGRKRLLENYTHAKFIANLAAILARLRG